MNKIQYLNPGGMPVTQDSLNFLQQALLDAITGLLSVAPATQTIILSGCALTLSGTYKVSAGYVALLSGTGIEICKVASADTGSANLAALFWNISDTPTPPDPVTFANQVSRNIHRTRTAVLNTSVSFNPYNSNCLTYSQAIANALGASPWQVVGAAGQPAYLNSFNGNVRFCKDLFGWVTIELGAIAGTTNNSIEVFILPAGYWPDVSYPFDVLVLDNSGNVIGTELGRVISGSGAVFIDGAVATGNQYIIKTRFRAA